jgi:ABC-type nitrate/sulfonate/bicarbonate transport system substrate-binding protein
MKKLFYLLLLTFLLTACAGETIDGSAEEGAATAADIIEDTAATAVEAVDEEVGQTDPRDVTLMLDWVPNVNHTGIYVAQEMGYFEEAGLNVEIVQPGEVYAEQAVVSGAAEFGISFQEQLTLAIVRQQAPLVSVAAIIQHNTSGFATRADTAVISPAEWSGLTYGSFATEFEEPTVHALMECAGGDPSTVQIVNVGTSDPLAMLQSDQIDLAWIFYGTQGVAAAEQGIELNVTMMSDHFDCIPDYYTPILITSQDMITNNPDVVRAFVGAVSRGYDFAGDNADEAAEILHQYAPESDADIINAQQEWLSPRYQANAPRWGEQTLEVWQSYAQWMIDQGIITGPVDMQAAFTNEFLP